LLSPRLLGTKKEPVNEPILCMVKKIECVGRTRTTIPSAIICMQVVVFRIEKPVKSSEQCFDGVFLNKSKDKK